MKSSNKTTPMIVGTLAAASIIGAVVLTQTDRDTPTVSGGTTSQTSQDTNSVSSSEDPRVASAATRSEDTTNTNTDPSTVSSSYKDGTYTGSTTYQVPGRGTNSIEVTLTIANGTVSAVKTIDNYSDHESTRYIDSFERSIESAVVGKAVESISLSRIGGASLTTIAFDNVVADIITQAQVG